MSAFSNYTTANSTSFWSYILCRIDLTVASWYPFETMHPGPENSFHIPIQVSFGIRICIRRWGFSKARRAVSAVVFAYLRHITLCAGDTKRHLSLSRSICSSRFPPIRTVADTQIRIGNISQAFRIGRRIRNSNTPATSAQHTREWI